MADHAHHDVHIDQGHDTPHVHHDEHPTWTIYWKVALVLTIITVAEVSAYYIPAWETSAIYVPSMLTMSAAMFAISPSKYCGGVLVCAAMCRTHWSMTFR